jgi:hypothetical protein
MLPRAGIVEGSVGIGGNGFHRHRNTWRIGQREIALRRHRLGRNDFQLAGPALAVKIERILVGDRRAFAAEGAAGPVRIFDWFFAHLRAFLPQIMIVLVDWWGRTLGAVGHKRKCAATKNQRHSPKALYTVSRPLVLAFAPVFAR